MAYHSFRPGQVWLDTEGKRIQAHGGSVFYEKGIYYWYGENKEKSDGRNGIWHWGVRCYSSRDLYNWKDEGIIIPPVEEEPLSPLHPSRCMDRPHIIYNKRTGKYVCWLKIMNEDFSQASTVLTADNLLGPYTMIRTGLYPLGMSAGDFDLAVAEDGKAYYYFERVHSETICADLTEDYTNVTGYYSTHFPRKCPPDVREATAHFMRKGKHYLLTSGTTGYYPNPTETAVADTGMDLTENWGVRIRMMRQKPLFTLRFHVYLKCREKRICLLRVLTAGSPGKCTGITKCTEKCFAVSLMQMHRTLMKLLWESLLWKIHLLQIMYGFP